MDRLIEELRGQVLLQLQFIVFAAEAIDQAMAAEDIDRVFFAIQNLLNAAANAAKALWGSGGRRHDERKSLRDSLGVSLRESLGVRDNSPLKSVAMRNNFEHFDERLEKWFFETSRRSLIDLQIGPSSMLRRFDDIDKLRSFDQDSWDVNFFGQDFNLKDILTEARSIIDRH